LAILYCCYFLCFLAVLRYLSTKDSTTINATAFTAFEGTKVAMSLRMVRVYIILFTAKGKVLERKLRVAADSEAESLSTERRRALMRRRAD
jgi:hypothetical protein